MFKKLAIATAISAVFASTTTFAEINTSTNIKVQLATAEIKQPSRFIVKFKTERSTSVQQNKSRSDNPIKVTGKGKSKLKFHRKLASGDALIEATEFSTMESLLADLALNGEVVSVEQDELVYAQDMPNDYYANSMYSIKNNSAGINAIAAWDLSLGIGVNVAIIDTGFTDHPDYDERSINGYDMISYLSHSIDGDVRDNDAHDPGTGIDCGTSNSSWHGTHVAGIIGASMNNEIGAMGIAPKANLIHVRALGKCSSGYRSDIIDGIYWAAGKAIDNIPVNPNPAKIINLSLGSQSSCGSYQAAIDYARAQGTTVVVSAGNNNIDAVNQSPANCDGVITVAASDNSGDKASYSNYSPWGGAIDVTAPGSSIIATVNSGIEGVTSPGYSFKSGTSMAAPQVAGVIALMLAKNPNLTPTEVEQILKDTADQFPMYSTCLTQSPICGHGLVNAQAAVLEAMSRVEPAPEPQPSELQNGVSIKIAGEEKSESLFSFNVPVGFTQVAITLSSGTGDADIYVKKDGQASFTNYDCRPWETGNTETCNFQEAGQYSIMVRGYNAYGEVNLTGSYQEVPSSEGTEIGNDQMQIDLSGEQDDELLFWADVPNNVTGLWVQTWSGSGDADLWVKKGAIPTAQDNDCYQSHVGNTEACTMEPTGGRYYIKVRGYQSFDDARMRIIWNN